MCVNHVRDTLEGKARGGKKKVTFTQMPFINSKVPSNGFR